jgi:hypothetical protein
MANDRLYNASLHLRASPQNKRSSLLYKIQTVGNGQHRGSAPGGLGLRPSHLQDMLRAPSEQARAALISELTAFVNRSFHGSLARALGSVARLSASDGVRQKWWGR